MRRSGESEASRPRLGLGAADRCEERFSGLRSGLRGEEPFLALSEGLDDLAGVFAKIAPRSIPLLLREGAFQ